MDDQFLLILKKRFEYAETYLSALFRFSNIDWPELYESYKNGSITFPEVFGLIHPDRYNSDKTIRKNLSGDRTFSPGPVRQTEQCMASVLWGYECKSSGEELVHADHLFPYSLGGVNNAQNLLYLCPVHNRIKAGDIHVYPWEKGAPDWLATTIESINKQISIKN